MKKELIDYPYLTRPISLYTLDNGHTIALAHKESKLINIASWVKTGSINENDANTGVSHFLEHLMFKGTTKYKAGEFDKILERKGGIINAATWKDYTFYYITISRNSLDLAIELHSDMIIDPALPEKEIGPAFDPKGPPPEEKRERYVVLEEIKMRNDQNWSKVYTKLNASMYEAHPYKRDVIGTPEVISQISRDDIASYYRNFYTPQNISTIVVGDFDEDEVLAKLIEHFKFADCNTCRNKVETVMELEIKRPKFIEQKTDVQTGYLMLGFLCDSAKNLKETIALDLISTILGEGKSSRLNMNLIETPEKPHYYSVDSCHYQFKDGDNFFVNANFDPEAYGVVVDEIKTELEKLGTISAGEFQKAKKQIKVDFASNSETVAKISDNIGYYLTVCEDLRAAQNYEKMLEEIDEKYLESIAAKYLDPQKCSVSVLLPEGQQK